MELTPHSRRLPSVLVVYWLLILILFASAVLTVWYRGALLHRPYPYNSFLFDPVLRFTDFTDWQHRFDAIGEREFLRHDFADAHSPFNYPPLSAVILFCFYRLHAAGLPALLATIMATAVLLTGLFARALRRQRLGTMIALAFALSALLSSFPLVFLFDRANLEGIVWIFVSFGLLASARDRWWLAAALFGVAAAMKLAPGILFALLLSRRKWREAAFGLAVAAGLTIASLKVIGPTIPLALRSSVQALLKLRWWLIGPPRVSELAFQHSLYSVVRQLMTCFDWMGLHAQTRALQLYCIAAAVGGLLLYFSRIRTRPLLNQIIALTTCAVLLPPWSGNYTLVHLYVPWGLLVLWIMSHDDANPRTLLWFLVPFAVIFTPQPYLLKNLHGFSGQVKALALAILLISSLGIPLKSELDNAPQKRARPVDALAR